MFGAVLLWAYGWLGSSRPPIVSDFMSFYGAGSLALAGTPQLAYDAMAHWHAEQAVVGPQVPHNFFFYPPPFLLLCAALALLPYMAAFLLFQAVTLVAYVVVAREIARLDGWLWLAPALAFPSVVWTLGLGQNAFLTAALLGGACLLVDSRPRRAGVLLGSLCYKPHFGVLIPLALGAGRRWATIASAGLTVVALAGGSWLVFGSQTWASYFRLLTSAPDVYQSGKVMLAGYVTPFGAVRLLGLPPGAAYGVQAASALVSAVVVIWLWRRNASLPVRSAALMAGTLLSVPLALLYDLMMISVCIAWFVRAGCTTGFLPWEKILLAVLYLVALTTLFVGLMVKVPIGPIAPAIVLSLCVRRYFWEQAVR
jgi:hypothetical protein